VIMMRTVLITMRMAAISRGTWFVPTIAHVTTDCAAFPPHGRALTTIVEKIVSTKGDLERLTGQRDKSSEHPAPNTTVPETIRTNGDTS